MHNLKKKDSFLSNLNFRNSNLSWASDFVDLQNYYALLQIKLFLVIHKFLISVIYKQNFNRLDLHLFSCGWSFSIWKSLLTAISWARDMFLTPFAAAISWSNEMNFGGEAADNKTLIYIIV